VSIAEWVTDTPERLRTRLAHAIRAAAGLAAGPPPICEDPDEAFTPVDAVVRLVHGDLPAMMIGGLASLFFEMLHPHTMAGVAQHSRYREDALGRVLQTANFITHTTYGSRESAQAAIERVRAIHERVRGVADDGQAYRASDEHLLGWIHCAGVSMFLAAYREFGAHPFSDADADRYVAEGAVVARALGVSVPPMTVAELRSVVDSYRPELRLTTDAVAARDFIARGVVRGAHQKAAYRLVVASSLSLLEPWAQDLLGVPSRPVLARTVVRPATRALNVVVRQAIPPVPPQVTSDRPPSTTTT